MHLHVIDNPARIKKYQNYLSEKLCKGERRKDRVGFQGGNMEIDLYRFPRYGLWWGYERADNRHWNAFGHTKDLRDASGSANIICEINFAFRHTWLVAGAFVEDEKGEIYMVHSGKIGGGRHGIGKSRFEERFRGEWVGVEKNGESKQVTVVSPLYDDSLIENIAHFVSEVHRIKHADDDQGSDFINSAFRPEFEGRRKTYTTRDEITADVEHGKIVRSLYEKAKGMNIDAKNNQQTDLLLGGKSGIAMVEVKTDTDPQKRYAAIGQLLYHSGGTNVKYLVAIFPSFDKRFRKVLEELDIAAVTWHKEDGTYKFGPELDRMLGDL